LDDYDASQVCRDCAAIIANNAENLFLLDLLREAVALLDDGPVKRRIEKTLAISRKRSAL